MSCTLSLFVLSLLVAFSYRSMSSQHLMYKCKKHLHELKGEVGMAVPKSTQTRVVGIITYTEVEITSGHRSISVHIAQMIAHSST